MKRVVTLLLLCICIGCSSNHQSAGETTTPQDKSKAPLDKSTAASELKTYLAIGDTALSVYVGRTGKRCVETQSNGEKITVNSSPDSDISSLIATRAGYITVSPDGKGFWKTALADQGSKALAPNEKPYAHTVGGGCDYQQVDFTLATPELVEVTAILGTERVPSVQYSWKWNVTELGRALRQDGKVYPTLNEEQRLSLGFSKRGLVEMLPIPVPPENFIGHSTAAFTRDGNGWAIH